MVNLQPKKSQTEALVLKVKQHIKKKTMVLLLTNFEHIKKHDNKTKGFSDQKGRK